MRKMERATCHVCEGKTSLCKARDGSCSCNAIATVRRGRASVLCSEGDYCTKVKENYVKSFIKHGIIDDCKNGLKIALEELIESKGDYNVMILLLLSLEKYENCFNLIRWFSSSHSNKQRVLPCAAHPSLAADMARYDADSGWSPLDQWTHNADILDDLDWMFGTQDCKLARLIINKVDNPPSHSLYIGLPVMVIHMASLEKMKRIKQGFWSFLLGTHPRLGESSLVRKLSGLYPVLSKLYKYCHFQPEVDRAVTGLENHMVQMLKLCRLRSLFIDIVDGENQAMWTIGACTVCQRGGDCTKGAMYDASLKSEPVEKMLRREDPDTFSLLEYSIQNAIGMDKCRTEKNYLLYIKSFVLKYMRMYQNPQPLYEM